MLEPSEKARISFESSGTDAPPFVTIHNSGVLSAGLTRQIARYGVSKRAGVEGLLSGRLQGDRKDFLAMVQSYGVGIEIVRKHQAPSQA
jgi:galactokinase/mevalonate kinase-like predicted kinase